MRSNNSPAAGQKEKKKKRNPLCSDTFQLHPHCDHQQPPEPGPIPADHP